MFNYVDTSPNGNNSTGDSVSTTIVGNRIASIPQLPSICFRVGSTEHTYAADSLASAIDEVRTRLIAAPGPALAHLTSFEAYSDDAIEALILLENDGGLRFTANNCAAPVPLFDVVITAIIKGLPITTLQRLTSIACRVAAAMPGPTDVFAQSIANRLRQADVRGTTKKAIQKQIARFRAASLNDDQSHESLIPVRQVLPEAPVPDGALIPPRFSLSEGGISADGVEPGTPSTVTAPVLITRQFRDQQTGAVQVEIAWLTSHGWQYAIVPRSVIANRCRIVDLSDRGVPVDSLNALTLVSFLSAFMATNESLIPIVTTSSQFGWQGAPANGQFLLGAQLLTATASLESPEIEFRGNDHGDSQAAKGFRCRGSYDAWREAMSQVSGFPPVLIAILAMFAAPLLAILDVANFIISFTGPTSVGKSTVIRLAASVFGDPDERHAGSLVRTWDVSAVAAERLAALSSDLPLILDDTSAARFPDAIPRAIYAFTGGQSRGRGSLDGLRPGSAFRSILVSTGEAPICSFSKDGGTVGRVIELWGSPFDQATAVMANFLQKLTDTVRSNHGHAGPLFIQFLIHNQSRWDEWRRQYHDALDQLRSTAGNSVGGRLAEYAALLVVAGKLASEAGVLPWDGSLAVIRLWPQLCAGQREQDRKLEALQQIHAWACANSHRFEGRMPNMSYTSISVSRELLGKWNAEPDWPWIAFLTEPLESHLKSLGHNPKEVIRNWSDVGWLLAAEGRRQYRVRIAGESAWCYCLRRDAIDSALDLNGSSGENPNAQTPRSLPALGSQPGQSGNVGGNTLSPPSS